MGSPDGRLDPKSVYLDPFLVDRARLPLGLALKQLALEAEVDYRTLRGIGRRAGLLPAKAKDIADVLRTNVLDLLAPWDPRYVPPRDVSGPAAGSAEWVSGDPVDQGRLAANGVYYVVSRMRHLHTRGKLGRGKYYHLGWLPPALRDALRHKLSRHADVCARIGVHPRVAVNFASAPSAGGEGWWVIDHWVGDRTLAAHLCAAPWPRETLPRLVLHVAQGLDALHRAEVVFRELAPARVILSDQDGSAVLTDFELAKLLDGSPSVSGEWPEDPYRAPEVDGGAATPQADLYSLAQVAAAALSGPAYDPGRATEILSAAVFPNRLGRLLGDCLEPVPGQRPAGLAPLLKELARWAGEGPHGTA